MNFELRQKGLGKDYQMVGELDLELERWSCCFRVLWQKEVWR